MLTADAFGVMPPIAKLTPAQAMYHFLSGYTAKVAGTEKGLGSEPEATFSTCFAAPFLPRRPEVYGRMLEELIQRYGVRLLAGEHRLERRPVRRRPAHEHQAHAGAAARGAGRQPGARQVPQGSVLRPADPGAACRACRRRCWTRGSPGRTRRPMTGWRANWCHGSRRISQGSKPASATRCAPRRSARRRNTPRCASWPGSAWLPTCCWRGFPSPNPPAASRGCRSAPAKTQSHDGTLAPPAPPPQDGGMSETMLDVKGMNCPLPVLRANRTLRGMEPGDPAARAGHRPCRRFRLPRLLPRDRPRPAGLVRGERRIQLCHPPPSRTEGGVRCRPR